MRLNSVKVILFIAIASLTTGNSAFAQIGKRKATAPSIKVGPAALVFKTKKDYRNKCTFILSDNKKKIISYPYPRTIKSGGTSFIPTRLKKGYLLDNRGIGLNV